MTPRVNIEHLLDLRIATQQLELRLGSRDELVELAHLAEDGIHPPDEMPFAVAWSDRIGSPGFVDEFVAFHEGQLAGWTPDGWHLNLLVWAAGTLAGTQGIVASNFGAKRTVGTGSWLGTRFQRRGYGTEMRAAVLELGFRGLGAVAAESGWIEGNLASARVSEKLGYREVGLEQLAPRGIPVVQHLVRIERAAWRCPIPVEISGLEQCLPLFGIAKLTR
jgi:RimJ/RimL family protein N-acetyltransferase